jgi:hypothetical protein
VVDEDELERRLLPVGRLRGRLGRLYDHPVLRSQRAAGLELGRALDLDEAHPAGPDRGPDARLVTEDRDLDAGGRGRLHQPGPLRHLHLEAVDHDRDELDAAHAGTGEATGEWVCMSLGATTPSIDDEPPKGQAPSSMWRWNSS